jgi:hypothetical protein
LITTPVAIGTNAAPKKRRNHNNGIMTNMLSKKPIGAANKKANNPKQRHILIALRTFFPL